MVFLHIPCIRGVLSTRFTTSALKQLSNQLAESTSIFQQDPFQEDCSCRHWMIHSSRSRSSPRRYTRLHMHISSFLDGKESRPPTSLMPEAYPFVYALLDKIGADLFPSGNLLSLICLRSRGANLVIPTYSHLIFLIYRAQLSWIEQYYDRRQYSNLKYFLQSLFL